MRSAILPDGPGVAVVSLPLPQDHWLFAPGHNEPPMPFRAGTKAPNYDNICEAIEAAARYAIRATTGNGNVPDFDPDAMVHNFRIGLIGYHTPDGR